jgi:hypothetical protein
MEAVVPKSSKRFPVLAILGTACFKDRIRLFWFLSPLKALRA